MFNYALGLRQKIGHWLNALSAKKRSLYGSFKGPIEDKKSVLLVSSIETEGDRQPLLELKKEFKTLCPGATVSIACLYDKTKGAADNFISDDNNRYFTEDAFSFFFKFRNKELVDFLSAGYDVAIFLTQKDIVCTDFASQYVVADLRVGLTGSKVDSLGILNFSVAKGDSSTKSVNNILDSVKMVFK